MDETDRRAALITGGSRGIGAAAAVALARAGFDVAFTYRNKAARAATVAGTIGDMGRASLPVEADITRAEDVERLAAALRHWGRSVQILVLNASGGLERDLVAADPSYPWRINRDAQLAVLDAILPLMPCGSTVVFVTSHWAHRYGQVEQLPSYEPVAQTKHAGEQALRARQWELADRGVRLLVVTGDLVQGTITPRLLERVGPGMTEQRAAAVGELPTTDDLGGAIADAALDPSLRSGHTVVVGGPLESLPALPQRHVFGQPGSGQ